MLFDEIQNAPELFRHIRARIDRRPRETGRWLFTGSQEAPLMLGVSESMAGRAAILQLMPFSLAETERVSLLAGGYPEVVARPRSRGLWFNSYIQTYKARVTIVHRKIEMETQTRAVARGVEAVGIDEFAAMLGRAGGRNKF